MTETAPITIDVVSDVVCPWCYIGLARLSAARRAVPEVEVGVGWRPFQLDPAIPPGGTDRRRYMLDKFGSGERLKQIEAGVEAAGREAGIDFAFDAMRVAANTLDAHRVIRWAGAAGNDTQNNLVRRLFQLNFEEGADIGEASVLVGAARDAGMDSTLVETLLPTDADTDAVRAEIETAARMGITGVPCFLIEGKYAVMGAQEPERLADAIRQVSAAKARGELDKA